MKSTNLFVLLVMLALVGVASANVTDERTYHVEETAIPFEVFGLLLGLGMLFLVIATITGFSYNAGMTMIFGLVSSLFLTASAMAAPVTGFYSYIGNTTTNATASVTPTIWLIMNPWMGWLCWGLASIAFLLFVFGILILFRERAHEEEMYWV